MSGQGHRTRQPGVAVVGAPEGDPAAVVPRVDASIPNAARIYAYLLGGKDNFAADRQAARELLRHIPDARDACHDNRAFVQRAVRFLAGQDIGQFIDIGAGLPARQNVHEIAQQTRPGARVAYVDHDPVVVRHAEALLATSRTVTVINADLRQPGHILTHPSLQGLISFGEPVAILLTAILHFIPDEDSPYSIVAELKAAMPPGSYLVISHLTADEVADESMRDARAVYDQATESVFPRDRAAISRFFDGLEFVGPGVTGIRAWGAQPARPGQARTLLYGGVARKP